MVRLVLGEFDEDSRGRRRVQERYALPFGSNAWVFVDKAEPGRSAACEGGIEILHGKADVMDSRSAFGEKLRDW